MIGFLWGITLYALNLLNLISVFGKCPARKKNRFPDGLTRGAFEAFPPFRAMVCCETRSAKAQSNHVGQSQKCGTEAQLLPPLFAYCLANEVHVFPCLEANYEKQKTTRNNKKKHLHKRLGSYIPDRWRTSVPQA